MSLWRCDRVSHAHFVFRPGADRVVSEGWFERGAVMRLPDRAYLNLYEPGAVRALLEEALRRGVFPASGRAEIDGWPLFDALFSEDGDPRRAPARPSTATGQRSHPSAEQ